MNICIIGSGKIATNLGYALKQKKNIINRICSRNKRTGKKLAKKLSSDYTNNIIVPKKTDLVIICVPDDNINEVAKKIVKISNSVDVRTLKNLKNGLDDIILLIQQFKGNILF